MRNYLPRPRNPLLLKYTAQVAQRSRVSRPRNCRHLASDINILPKQWFRFLPSPQFQKNIAKIVQRISSVRMIVPPDPLADGQHFLVRSERTLQVAHIDLCPRQVMQAGQVAIALFPPHPCIDVRGLAKQTSSFGVVPRRSSVSAK